MQHSFVFICKKHWVKKSIIYNRLTVEIWIAMDMNLLSDNFKISAKILQT